LRAHQILVWIWTWMVRLTSIDEEEIFSIPGTIYFTSVNPKNKLSDLSLGLGLNAVSLNVAGTTPLFGVTYERILSYKYSTEIGIGIVSAGVGIKYFPDPTLLTGMRWKAIPGNIIPLPEGNYLSPERIRKKRWIFFLNPRFFFFVRANLLQRRGQIAPK